MPEGSTERLAVFDFCETLADFQTANAFVNYVRQHTRSISIRWRNAIWVILVKAQVFNLVNILTSHNNSFGKKVKLWQLHGLKQETLEALALRFYNEQVVPHLIGATICQIRQLQNEGYKVGLSSGGYDIYLKHFVKAYGLDFCHCSKLAFKNGRCTGRMIGKDCMRDEKVKQLAKSFGNGANAVAFSDSLSDLPLMKWASRGVVISRGKHQQWSEKYHFEEIIW